MADGILGTELKSKKAPTAATAKATPAYVDKDHMSALLLELGNATAIVDLLYMVAAGRAVDSIDALQADTLANSLNTALDRLYAVKDAANAILDEQIAARKSAREVAHV